jgi:hypothetical protein
MDPVTSIKTPNGTIINAAPPMSRPPVIIRGLRATLPQRPHGEDMNKSTFFVDLVILMKSIIPLGV